MAEKSGEPVSDDEFKNLRKVLLSGLVKQDKFLAKIEETKDKTFTLTLTETDSNKQLGNLRFRKWRHGEVALMKRLPYYDKLFANQPLTPEESQSFRGFKREMINLGLLDVGRWQDILDKRQDLLDPLYNMMASISGATPQFTDELNEFLNSELGYGYGLIWFGMLHKTPSEVAALSETDYQTVLFWFAKWFERLKQEQNKT